MKNSNGKVTVVGIGPGSPALLTARAAEALEECDLVIGYRLYVDQVAELVEDKRKEYSVMGREVDRCHRAVKEALCGMKVALVSGGDPGIYGMAGLLLQVAQDYTDRPQVEIIPGVTAAGAASAVLGAPLMHDFAVVSLSDRLTPWDTITKRLRAAADADFIIVLYNPRSHGRSELLMDARQVLLEQLPLERVVGIVRSAGRDGEQKWQTTLRELPALLEEINMASLVVIGNSHTYWKDGYMITPRGYRL